MYFSFKCPINDRIKISLFQDHIFNAEHKAAKNNPPTRLILSRKPLWGRRLESKAQGILAVIQQDIRDSKDEQTEEFARNEMVRDGFRMFLQSEKFKGIVSDGYDIYLDSQENSSDSEGSFYKKLTDDEKAKLGKSKRMSATEKGKEILDAFIDPVASIKNNLVQKKKDLPLDESNINELFEAEKNSLKKELKYVTGHGQSQENTIILE